MQCIVVCVFLLLCPFGAIAQSVAFDDLVPDATTRYYVRLLSGDELTGAIVDIVDDDFDGAGIQLRTAIGTATVFEWQIAEIRPLVFAYPHPHRLFVMPTALPIGEHEFIGLYELLFLYGGFGFQQVLSFTAGRTFVPSVPSEQQATLLMLKATLYDRRTEKHGEGVTLAVGGNLAYLNKNNPMTHLYGVGTWSSEETHLNALVFAKVSGADSTTVRMGTLGDVGLLYAKGTVGIGAGLDTRLAPGQRTIRFIGELWLHDVTQPKKAVAMAGVRLWNTDFSADFGLAVFRGGVAPVASFVWTPRIQSL